MGVQGTVEPLSQERKFACSAAIDKASSTSRFNVLDAWRGIAALSVALVHFPHWHGWDGAADRDVWALYVPFFFILSAFVLSHSVCRRNLPFRRYAVRRFARLWPLHAVTFVAVPALFTFQYLAMGVASELFFSGRYFDDTTLYFQRFTLQAFVDQLLFLQYIGATAGGWNAPNWSIGIEFWVSLAFFFVFASRVRVWWLLLAAAGCAGALYADQGFLDAQSRWIFGVVGFNRGVVTALMCFSIGAVSYRAWQRVDTVPGWIEWPVLAGVVLVMYVFPAVGNEWAILVLIPIVFVFSFESGPVSRFLALSAFQYLGRVSYSIYLVHAPVLIVFPMLVRITEKAPWLVRSMFDAGLDKAIYVAVVLVIAGWTYRVIEVPAQRWILQKNSR